jgi:hypothetical protein
MNRLQIHTPDGWTNFTPGAEIDLVLSWDLESPPAALELRLVWNTAGKGTTDLSIVQSHPIESPAPRDSQRMTITLPTSPYSFSGKLVSLIWALELVALPGLQSTRQEIIIAPAGREVVLQPVEKERSGEWGINV